MKKYLAKLGLINDKGLELYNAIKTYNKQVVITILNSESRPILSEITDGKSTPNLLILARHSPTIISLLLHYYGSEISASDKGKALINFASYSTKSANFRPFKLLLEHSHHEISSFCKASALQTAAFYGNVRPVKLLINKCGSDIPAVVQWETSLNNNNQQLDIEESENIIILTTMLENTDLNENDDLSVLPNEMLQQILSYLPAREHIRMREVSRRFNNLIVGENGIRTKTYVKELLSQSEWDSNSKFISVRSPGLPSLFLSTNDIKTGISHDRFKLITELTSQAREIQIMKEWSYNGNNWDFVDKELKKEFFEIKFDAFTFQNETDGLNELNSRNLLIENIHIDLIRNKINSSLCRNYVNLHGLNLTRFPEKLLKQPELFAFWVTNLDLSANKLVTIPEAFGKLLCLTKLNLDNNLLSKTSLQCLENEFGRHWVTKTLATQVACEKWGMRPENPVMIRFTY